MKITFSTLVVLVVLTVTLGACQSAAGETIIINEQHTGQTIELNTGDFLEVMLNGNITTGFNWVPVPQNPELLEQVGDVQVTPASDLIGAPGVIVLKFKAIRAGETNLHLDYKQPWDAATAPEQTFDVTVVVN